jgi:hypothetical protein
MLFSTVRKVNSKARATFSRLIEILKKTPGKDRFGDYRFLPYFFLLGASIEYLMINWKAGPNQINFYSVLKRNKAKSIIKEKLDLEEKFIELIDNQTENDNSKIPTRSE